jgi:hypothetical protein
MLNKNWQDFLTIKDCSKAKHYVFFTNRTFPNQLFLIRLNDSCKPCKTRESHEEKIG